MDCWLRSSLGYSRHREVKWLQNTGHIRYKTMLSFKLQIWTESISQKLADMVKSVLFFVMGFIIIMQYSNLFAWQHEFSTNMNIYNPSVPVFKLWHCVKVPSRSAAHELIQTSGFKSCIKIVTQTVSSLRLDWQMREDESFLTLQILFSQLLYLIYQVNKNNTILKSILKGRIRPNGLKTRTAGM